MKKTLIILTVLFSIMLQAQEEQKSTLKIGPSIFFGTMKLYDYNYSLSYGLEAEYNYNLSNVISINTEVNFIDLPINYYFNSGYSAFAITGSIKSVGLFVGLNANADNIHFGLKGGLYKTLSVHSSRNELSFNTQLKSNLLAYEANIGYRLKFIDIELYTNRTIGHYLTNEGTKHNIYGLKFRYTFSF